jgi:hypothetical protein
LVLSVFASRSLKEERVGERDGGREREREREEEQEEEEEGDERGRGRERYPFHERKRQSGTATTAVTTTTTTTTHLTKQGPCRGGVYHHSSSRYDKTERTRVQWETHHTPTHSTFGVEAVGVLRSAASAAFGQDARVY